MRLTGNTAIDIAIVVAIVALGTAALIWAGGFDFSTPFGRFRTKDKPPAPVDNTNVFEKLELDGAEIGKLVGVEQTPGTTGRPHAIVVGKGMKIKNGKIDSMIGVAVGSRPDQSEE